MEETEEEEEMENYYENRGGYRGLGCWVAYIVACVYRQSHFVST